MELTTAGRSRGVPGGQQNHRHHGDEEKESVLKQEIDERHERTRDGGELGVELSVKLHERWQSEVEDDEDDHK